MRKIQEVLRLHVQAGLSERTIAKSVALSRSTVAKIISRSREAGLSWPLPADMDEGKLESMLFPIPLGRPKNCFEPDWNQVHQELKRKGVTLQLLWMEYKEQHLAPMSVPESRDLLDLLDERTTTHSTCIVSQLPLDLWHEHFTDPALADAILDRIIHTAHKLQIKGESMRKLKSPLLEENNSGK